MPSSVETVGRQPGPFSFGLSKGVPFHIAATLYGVSDRRQLPPRVVVIARDQRGGRLQQRIGERQRPQRLDLAPVAT